MEKMIENFILWVYSRFWCRHRILVGQLQESGGAFDTKLQIKQFHWKQTPPHRDVLTWKRAKEDGQLVTTFVFYQVFKFQFL